MKNKFYVIMDAYATVARADGDIEAFAECIEDGAIWYESEFSTAEKAGKMMAAVDSVLFNGDERAPQNYVILCDWEEEDKDWIRVLLEN